MKKGFTLIELIGVIVVLGIIALLAFPPILNMIKNSKTEKLENSKKLILADTSQYVEDNLTDFPRRDGNVFCIELGKVFVPSFIDSSFEGMNENTLIKATYTSGKFEYTFAENNQCERHIAAINADKSGANKPLIESDLIPIKWNGSQWIKANKENESGQYQWYDYNNQMWANAVVVNSNKANDYKNAEPGTFVLESDILDYLVWIPRYEYKYTNLGNQYALGTQSNPGEISINFINNTITTSNNEYKIHPTFEIEGMASGFWMAKFEGYSSKPNISVTGAILNNSTNPSIIPGIIDGQAHFITNNEWGAVAYLSQSKYGKYGNKNFTNDNKKIFVNSYIGDINGAHTASNPMNFSSLTGCSLGSHTGKPTTKCPYTYEVEYYGTGASTTGTIYGVYDMSGGHQEFVLANYNKNLESIYIDEKYANIFTTSVIDTACNGSICYGQALSEMSGWYNESIIVPTTSEPWLFRGNSIFEINKSIFYTAIGNKNKKITQSFYTSDITQMKTDLNLNRIPYQNKIISTNPRPMFGESRMFVQDTFAYRLVIIK